VTVRHHDNPAEHERADEVAALRATVEVQQLGLNRLSAEVRQLTDQLTDLVAHQPPAATVDAAADGATDTGEGEKPAPWSWRHLPERQAAALWRELADWLTWLHTRYPLAETIPACWWRHPEIVEELTAAHAAWKAAYTSPGASPYAPGEWHDRWLPGLEHRLATRWRTGRCTEAHQPRSNTAYGTALDDPDAFARHTQPTTDSTSTVPESVPMTEITDAVTSGDAEIIGADLGDPIYWRGTFWQITPDADAYQQVHDPEQLRVLNDARRRLRLAANTPETAPQVADGAGDEAGGTP
jgi:hypothetical protein